MTALETSVRECCVALLSARATERKKNGEILKDFLIRNAVPSLLSENTIKRQGYSWNEVFDDIHEFVLKELEKFESSKTFDAVIAPLCANLLHLCVSGSSKGRAYIKCNKIIDACLFILKDRRLSRAIGEAYLNLLYKDILPCEYYLNLITLTGWEDLLNVSLDTCLSKDSKLDDFTKMRLLALIMKNATNCTQVVIPLRDSLPKLKKIFLVATGDKKIQEIIIEIMILLLETLSTECRLTMCDFIESHLSSVLNFYDQNLDYKKKVSFFKLLHLAVMIHHPQGRKQQEDGSLALNWQVWNKHLNNFLEVVCLEVSFLQKLRKQEENLLKYCDQYYNVAAAVYFQIFNMPQAVEEQDGNSSKRQRVTFNKNKCFQDLVQELKHNHIPWLGIINEYVKKFGNTISLDDYTSLVIVMETFITSNANVNWNTLEETTRLATTLLSENNSEHEMLLSLWNSCVRTSTVVNTAHIALHKIIKVMLTSIDLKYEDVQPLIKLYSEKGMPVSDSSLVTLNCLLHKFFNKCSSVDERQKYFSWLIEGQIMSLEVSNVREFFLRLLTTENVNLTCSGNERPETDNVRHVLFNSIEKSILFSEFELVIRSTPVVNATNESHVEMFTEVNREIRRYLRGKLSYCIEKLKHQEELLECINFLNITLSYLDVLLRYKFLDHDDIRVDEIHCLLKSGIIVMYMSLTNILENVQVPHRVQLLKGVQAILIADYDSLLALEVRQCMNEDFFQCLNKIMNKNDEVDEEEILFEGDEEDPNPLVHNCTLLLAAYCMKCVSHRNETLEFVLDPKMYNFFIPWDFDCAINCIKLMERPHVDDPPLELMFILMQHMCKQMFRNSKASYKILTILEGMLDKIWSQEGQMRQNCHIMIKSYMRRAKVYPPQVAALVYACAVKIVLNLSKTENRDTDSEFTDTLLDRIKGDNHNIRVYCCYLLKLLVVHMSESDIQTFVSGLSKIFLIEISETSQTVLQDERTNRTLTVLHCFLMLAQTKNTLVHNIVMELIQMQKEKSLDTCLVKKVLNRITNVVCNKKIEVYLNENILSIINFWFLKGNKIEDLPLNMFGFENMDVFIEKYMKWLIPAEILWSKGGIVAESEVLKRVTAKSGKSVDSIVEICLCNIIVLSLPYVVLEQYRLNYCVPGKTEWSSNADKLFRSTRETILGIERWSSLFVENMNELVILIATHLNTHAAAKEYYNVDTPQQTKSYHYPKEVFDGILKYIEELIEEDTMNYLCEHQPLAIFKALIKLWENVLNENIFEFKVLLLHNFMTLLETIPQGHQSDAFVCKFACSSISHAVKNSQSKHEIRAFAKALKTVFERFLIRNVDILRKAVSEVLSILMIKTEEGFNAECAELLDYLVNDMKDCLKQSEDVIDFVASLSQRTTENVTCSTKVKFLEKLQIFSKSLSCPSHETLLKLRLFLKVNKNYTLKLSDELNNKGFSDDCGNSVIHKIIYALCKTLKDASDDKTKIEACNCLSEIGNYDLKTLVTVPPSDMKRVLSVHPKQYFAIVVMSSLAEVLFDEQPRVTNGAAKTLKRLLQYREGKTALDLEKEGQQILQPFASTQYHTVAEFKINEAKFNSLRHPEQWLLNPDEVHTKWLIRLTAALLDVLAAQENYLNVLRSVCLVKPEVCRKILPSLMGVLLECASDEHVKIISELLNHFFKHIWNSNFDSIENSEDSISRRNSTALDQDHKMVVQYMLNIVNFIRLQKSNYKSRSDRIFETYNYLRLDYDKVAWAATIADQNLAAIYYGELWANAQNGGVPPSSPEATTLLNGGEDVQKIFRKCYVSIGELDAIDGCGTTHLTSEEEKRKHLINTGQFTDALLLHDIALSSGGQVDPHLQHGVVKSLHKSGMHHLALQYIKSLPENDEFNNIKYECLSFLGDWSDFVDIRELEDKFKQPNSNPNSIAKALRYSCLKDCLNLHTTPDFESKVLMPLNYAKLAIAKLCQNLNMENCQNVYKVLTKLRLLDDIEDYFSVRCNKLTIKTLLDEWQVDRLPVFNDFKYLEALVSQRNLILEYAAKAYNDFLKDITSLQLQYAELGLSNQRIKMAQRLLAVVKRLQNSQDVALIDSQISWAKGHKDIALSLLRNIVSDPSPDVRLTAVSLRQYGLWMAESKCDNPRDIIDKYLKKSLKVLSQNDHVDTRLKVYYDIAKFADAEYKQVVTYMNSTVFEKKLNVLENMKDAACTLRSQAQPNLSKDERKALAANEKFGKIEEAEIAGIRTEKESFLHLAMRYYLLSLKLSEGNNLSVFRVISLWLDNPGLEFVNSEDGNFENLLHSIPSRKYVTAIPQLAPRLTNETTLFANNLRNIIKRCAIDHPHHTLPILFSLKNSDKDKFILNASSNQSGTSQATRPRCNEPRVAAAEAMITQLASETGLTVVIEQMEKMCEALISFANFTPRTKDPNQKQKIPKAEHIHRLGHLDAIPIPIVTIPIRNDCNYLDIPTLVAFENYFETVGGINCPKKINCKGSDGISRILLIKGEDDLRQDAVMQQVFNIVNILIEKDPITSRNKLNIRTYKVVPMSRKSGVLEWCEGTMPIGTYLVGNSGAHARYHPQDISAQVARQKLITLYERRRPNQEKLSAFLRLMKEFRPAFHYFFTEHYLDPVTWYERRLAYTKSVAASSMVGYILGLGDRHLQNILIDKNTAEVVHIDFGIAFDQGKTLPTPETIPFRLTQDIVAPFGCSGVEGIFRRCCEKTMQLLRDNQDTLLTILEVLLCDPLYSWTTSSKQQDVLTIQTASSDGSLAKRALLTVSSKLSGTEGGVTGGVAVPGQVARLIHSAMDPVNLSRLYPGWQPYL